MWKLAFALKPIHSLWISLPALCLCASECCGETVPQRHWGSQCAQHRKAHSRTGAQHAEGRRTDLWRGLRPALFFPAGHRGQCWSLWQLNDSATWFRPSGSRCSPCPPLLQGGMTSARGWLSRAGESLHAFHGPTRSPVHSFSLPSKYS